MSNIIPALFNKSLIAAAVVSLSACSTTPRIEDYDLSRVGEGILSAGRTTADVSERVWKKTSYLLGFTDGDSEPRSDEGLLMDAEDMALLDDSTTVPRDTTIRPIVIRSAIPTRPLQVETPINAELADNDQTEDLQTPIKRGKDELAQAATNTDTTTTPTEPVVLAEDRVHKVAANETLWEIAKVTTGDANNWHVLADVNNLGPNASVFRGDLLIIPADMLKPTLNDDAPSDASASHSSKQIYVDTQNLTGSVKSQPSAQAALPQLEIPTTVQANVSDTVDNQPIAGKAFKLNPGETLWNLAKRTTGDATNWKAIAGQNNLSVEQASVVHAGQTIYVPEELIEPKLESAIHKATSDLSTAAGEQAAEPATTQEAIQSAADATRTSIEKPAPEQTDALRTLTISSASTLAGAAKEADFLNVGISALSASSSIIKAGQPMKIVEATFKSDDIAAPLGQRPDTIKSVDTDAHSPEQIMVSGTYYPKAIYNNADFSSSLLMRVSPGTTLEVSKAMGNWYQVNTSKGLGYVHQRDIK